MWNATLSRIFSSIEAARLNIIFDKFYLIVQLVVPFMHEQEIMNHPAWIVPQEIKKDFVFHCRILTTRISNERYSIVIRRQ
jgi:hypothetical protein